MARPKDADAAATYDSIVAAALEVLAEIDNPAKLSMRGVAVRADVSLGTIQYHFANKEALLEGCLDGYHERLGALAQRMITAAHDPSTDRGAFIADSVRTMYRFVRSERTAIRLRLATNTAKGELHPTRQPEFMGSLTAAAAMALAPFTDVDNLEVRMSIQAMAILLVRFALLSESELTNLTALPPDEAREAAERYVVRAACRLVEAPVPQS